MVPGVALGEDTQREDAHVLADRLPARCLKPELITDMGDAVVVVEVIEDYGGFHQPVRTHQTKYVARLDCNCSRALPSHVHFITSGVVSIIEKRRCELLAAYLPNERKGKSK